MSQFNLPQSCWIECFSCIVHVDVYDGEKRSYGSVTPMVALVKYLVMVRDYYSYYLLFQLNMWFTIYLIYSAYENQF